MCRVPIIVNVGYRKSETGCWCVDAAPLKSFWPWRWDAKVVVQTVGLQIDNQLLSAPQILNYSRCLGAVLVLLCVRSSMDANDPCSPVGAGDPWRLARHRSEVLFMRDASRPQGSLAEQQKHTNHTRRLPQAVAAA